MPAVERAAWPGLDADALYWSEDGRICCASDTPYPGTDTWISGRWQIVRRSDLIAWTLLGHQPVEMQCEICGKKDGRK